MRRALFIGRFQPFHKGHLKAVLHLLKEYDKVIIVIGSAQYSRTPDNPFSARERVKMIRLALKRHLKRLKIIPVSDVNSNEKWVAHLSSYVPKYDDVYSNNSLVRRLFAEKGVKVRGTGSHNRQVHQGKRIRRLMASGGDWRSRVPKEVADYLEKVKGSKKTE